MLQNEPPQAPPDRLSQLRSEAFDYLLDMVNTVRHVASRTNQLPDLDGPPAIKKETFKDVLFADA